MPPRLLDQTHDQHLIAARRVLADFETPPADIYAVFPERLNLSAKVTRFLEHLRAFLGDHSDGPGAGGTNW